MWQSVTAAIGDSYTRGWSLGRFLGLPPLIPPPWTCPCSGEAHLPPPHYFSGSPWPSSLARKALSFRVRGPWLLTTGFPCLVLNSWDPSSTRLICQNDRPQTHGSVKRRGDLSGTGTPLHPLPAGRLAQHRTPVSCDTRQLSTRKDRRMLGTSSNLAFFFFF